MSFCQAFTGNLARGAGAGGVTTRAAYRQMGIDRAEWRSRVLARPVMVPFIQFFPEDNKVAGMASVNLFAGKFSVNGDQLKIDPGAMTRMAGEERLMRQEDAFVKALAATKSGRINGDTLELLADGRVLARLARR